MFHDLKGILKSSFHRNVTKLMYIIKYMEIYFINCSNVNSEKKGYFWVALPRLFSFDNKTFHFYKFLVFDFALLIIKLKLQDIELSMDVLFRVSYLEISA